MGIAEERRGIAAFTGYLNKLSELVSGYPKARILELGGGRAPSFTLAELPSNVDSYTVNDISAEELSLVAPEYERACFDVVGDTSDFVGQFDVIFSRTLAEHVSDGRKMHENVLSMLRPGGVAFHMMPTLYSPPFVINRLLPETLSHKILVSFFPQRRDIAPKFPAPYSWCYGSRPRMSRMLKEVGYSKVDIETFYGHGYFEAVPVVKQIDAALSSLAARRDWSWYGSYAYLVLTK